MSKRREEIVRTNDPNYWNYHKFISHPIQKCKVFKKQVMEIAKERNIILNAQDIEESG